jgi:hypothetical protein
MYWFSLATISSLPTKLQNYRDFSHSPNFLHFFFIFFLQLVNNQYFYGRFKKDYFSYKASLCYFFR